MRDKPSIEFRILGLLEARVDAQVVTPRPAKPRALLAALVAHANEALSTERIIGMLWDDDETGGTKGVVQQYVNQLRTALEPGHLPKSPYEILTGTGTSTGYKLNVAPGQLDLQHFDRLVAEGRAALADGRPGAAASVLKVALDLWTGEALENVTAPFVQSARARLEEKRLMAIHDRIEADLALGRHADVIEELAAQLDAYPHREPVAAQLMLALYRSGRQHEALAVHEQLANRLREELGADPSREVQRLFEKILNQAEELDLPSRPDIGTGSPVGTGRLPAQVSSFVGRERQIAEVKQRLLGTGARLLAITGPGGAGKTRLAIQVASELQSAFRDGVVYVPLANVTDDELVASSLARAVGVRQKGDGSFWEDVVEHLSQREVLLVFDNFEQVLPAATLLAQILEACARVSIMVTSRTAVDVYGAQEYAVSPLLFPNPKYQPDALTADKYEAIQLFVDRARAVRPDFELRDANVSAVVGICAYLEGLPLSIELAAAMVRTLPPETLLDRLRLDLSQLDRGPPGLADRHQTLQATIAWSYNLLSNADRHLLRQLAVFSGSWSLDAAEAICESTSGVLIGIDSLVRASLVRPEDGLHGQARFGMLELIRQFAGEHLSQAREDVELTERHAQYYVRLAEAAAPQLRGPLQAQYLAQLEVEHDNLRKVLIGSHVSVDSQLRLRLGAALWMSFWETRWDLNAGRTDLEALLATTPDIDTPERASVLNGAGALSWRLNEFEPARDWLEKSLEMNRRLGQRRQVAIVLNSLGNLAWAQGAYALAESRYLESLALRHELDDRPGSAMCFNNLGTVASDRCDYALARIRHRESLAIRRELDDQTGIAQSLHNLGEVELRCRNFAQARDLLRESLSRFDKLGNKMYVADDLGAFARLAESLGEPELAACWFGATEALRREIHVRPALTDRQTYESSVAAIQAAIGDTRLKSAWGAGASAPVDQIVADALRWSRTRKSRTSLGRSSLTVG
jgi:predicted ATPase/DNA-binding SARP family transcriptional activator